MLDTKRVLQENLKALLDTRPETSRLNLSREMGVADGTLGSIQYGKGNPTIQVLETIAQFFELETWQLLSPELGQPSAHAQTRISAEGPRRWPFAEIKPVDINTLPLEDRDEIEHQIAYKITRFKAKNARRKKRST